jgi:hypothetical protein
MKNISSALVKAQREFGPALKSSTNPHFKSRYADLAACVEAVIDALNANGIALIQKAHQADTGVVVETIFVHESGEQISNGMLHVPASKNDPQGYGSALTYARRYSLMAACGIAPEDDDGNAASRKVDGYKEYEDKHLSSFREKALLGVVALEEAYKSLPASQYKSQFWSTWGAFLKTMAEKNNGATKSDRLSDIIAA